MESLFGKKTPQPFPGGEPDTEEGWRLQEERIKKETAANKPGVLSTISDTFNSFFGKKEGGRRPTKKPKKPKKKTKNKRR